MRYINKTYKYIVLFLFILAMGTSCDDGFTELNVHPMKPTETSLNFIFTGYKVHEEPRRRRRRRGTREQPICSSQSGGRCLANRSPWMWCA